MQKSCYDGKNKGNELIIPEGFKIKDGNVDNGLVIENSNGDQYVRIPSGYNSDGVFVRGFWISRYEISKGNDNEPRSISGEYPWVNIDFIDATRIAQSIDGELISGEEYSRICMWLVQSGAATFQQVYVNGIKMENQGIKAFKLRKTGTNLDYMHNHICDFFGNGYLWTTERSELYHHRRVIRGGYNLYNKAQEYYPPTNRGWAKETEKNPKKNENQGQTIIKKNNSDKDDDRDDR